MLLVTLLWRSDGRGLAQPIADVEENAGLRMTMKAWSPAMTPFGHSSPALFLAPPVEYAADATASVERFLLLRVQAVVKRLKLGLDCLQAGELGLGHLCCERHSARRRRKIWLVGA